MKNEIEAMITDITATTAEAEDYTGEDGLLYCGKCHTPKEAYFSKETAQWLGHDRHPAECDCHRAAREKREAAESRQKHLEKVEDLKRRGFTDPAMRNWTFEHDNGRNPQTETARFYVESWETMQAENIGYLFWGGVGTGKSYLAACIANALMEKEVAVCMTNFATILGDLAASFEGRNEYISRLCSYPLLILDDFGMERGTEYGLEQVYSVIDSRYRSGKPLIATTKAEQASVKANAEYLYQKALHDDPALAASNPVSRFLQKQRIKRNYAKELRQAEKTTKNTAATAKSAAQKAKDAFKETFLYIKHHSRAVLLVIGIGACVALLFGGVSSCSMMAGSGVGGVFTSSYLSDDTDMLAAEAAYCELEQELQYELDHYEALHPGYDEYRFDLDEIEHDPYVLISILTAFHEGVFTIDEVQAELQMLFEKQYILTQTVEVEVRYRTETRTDSEGNDYDVEVPYNYYICKVKLENFDLSHVPVYIMDEETLSLYAVYMATLGNREDLFPGSGYVDKYTKPPTTYDIPPSALEDETFAALITEAEKYIGYPYVWGGSNPNTSFDCSGFVSWALTQSGVCNTGRLGAQGLYNISTPVSSANARPGDLIFFVGTYDTPGVSHVGIYVGGGKMLHCGDPIQYADINTSYWQSHFYAFGRPPYN